MAVKPVPEGFHTVTPQLTVDGAARAIDFYKRAFGAVEVMRKLANDGTRIMHAEVRIGDSVVMLNDTFPEMPGSKAPTPGVPPPVAFYLYVPDVDASIKRAVDAGAHLDMAPQDMFWGDRFGRVTDPFGHGWGMATHKEDLTPEEIDRRAAIQMGGAKS